MGQEALSSSAMGILLFLTLRAIRTNVANFTVRRGLQVVGRQLA
jgi:hypothetical protein